MLFRYRYKDTKLTCEGVLDFLKGPKWIWELNPEEMNTELAKLADKLSYIDEFREGPVPLVKAGDPIKDYQKHDEVVIWDKQSERAILVKKDLIQRIHKTGPQKNLTLRERQNNLKKAFKICQNDVKLSTIVIIDDIYTTGSTMDAMAEELHRNGVRKIYGMALASGRGV